jgi:hypothetical protein
MQLKFGLNIPQTLEEICDPMRMALLVYDMQVGVVPSTAAPRNRGRPATSEAGLSVGLIARPARKGPKTGANAIVSGNGVST